MLVYLTEAERDYLQDKVFWDLKYAELAVMATESLPRLQESHPQALKEEAFFKKLYNKLEK